MGSVVDPMGSFGGLRFWIAVLCWVGSIVDLMGSFGGLRLWSAEIEWNAIGLIFG